MTRKRVLFPFLFSFFLIISGLIVISINSLQQLDSDKSESKNIILYPNAYGVGDTLNPNDIILDNPSIFQYFESINITVDTSHFTGGVNYTFVELNDLDQHHEHYNMTHVGNDIFSINYSTSMNESSQLLGLIKVTFSIYNKTGDLLNAGTTSKNFTIKPNIGVSIFPKNSTFHKGDPFSATLSPDGISMALYGWDTWNISIDDDLDKDEDLFSFSGYNQTEITFVINASFDEFNKDYYIHVNLINDTTNEIINSSYHAFTLENTNPTVIVSTVSLNSTSIFRSEVDNCHIQLNVTDLETTNPIFINVSMTLELSLDTTISIGNLENDGSGIFQRDFHVGYTRSIGNYRIKLMIYDTDGGLTEYIYGTPLEVKNNAPKINGFMINNIPITQGFSIYYSESLTFTFNVSDVDGEITDITVVLISSNDQRIERKADSNSEIYFSSYELVAGVWYVYIYIEDSDGAIVSLTDDYYLAPQAIKVIPDILSAVLPWIALVIGLIIGLLIGVGIAFYWIKSKTSESQDITSKKKSISQKGPYPKKQKGRDTSKAKIGDSEAKKITEKEQEKKTKPGKETPQRKIKRKL